MKIRSWAEEKKMMKNSENATLKIIMHDENLHLKTTGKWIKKYKNNKSKYIQKIRQLSFNFCLFQRLLH